MSPKIVYEDINFLVINKPAGLITHRKNLEDKQPSVVDWVIENYPELKNIGEPFIASGHETDRVGIVHRLDKETSGLLLVAKNNEAFFYFKNLFQTRKIKKYYLALVHGHLKNSSGVISSPLGRIGLKRTTKIEGKRLIDKKEAETEYRVIKDYSLLATGYSLLELSPKTGRTHQLRVHLNSIGHPIAGDSVYGFKKSPPLPGLNRLFLHAYKLEFVTPSSAKATADKPDGKSMALEADLPDDLSRLLENPK